MNARHSLIARGCLAAALAAMLCRPESMALTGPPSSSPAGNAAPQPATGAVPDDGVGQALSPEAWTAGIHAGWVGKVSAGSGALPTEMATKEAIQRKYGTLKSPPGKPTSRGPLDDTTLALLGWHAAQENGASFTSADIARQWVDHLSDADLKGGGFGGEFRDALRRLRQGEKPPVLSGTARSEWIAAQMRAEIWGMLVPGDARRAAELAARDAEVFNTGNGVYAAQFIAALTSRLMVSADIPKGIDAALDVIPRDSALAKMIRQVLAWHKDDPKDWEKAWQLFAEAFRDRTIEKRLAAWGGDWLIETSGWPEMAVLDEYQGRKTVLRTHPFSQDEPARLTSVVDVPAKGGRLKVEVACNDAPPDVDWLLRVKVEETAKELPIARQDGLLKWQELSVDLKPWAGKTVTVVLENAARGKMAWEAGFWARPELTDADGRPLASSRPAERGHRYPLEFTPRILPETFCVLVGLLYGEGDFRRSVSLATQCGFDTDCNAGTVGCLLGIRNGLDGIPAEWKDPLNGTYDVQVTGLPRQWKIADLARQMVRTGQALAAGRERSTSAPAALPASR